MNTKNKQFGGFTITELLITTAIFSTVLLISIVGFLQIGQIFYKGVTATRTHEATRDTVDSIVADIRFASVISQTNDEPTGYRDSRFFCAGNHRYTFNPGFMVDQANYNQADRFGLIRDTLPVAGSCGSPINSSGATSYFSPQELLGNRMRVAELLISQLSPADPLVNNLYTISVKIAYGDDSSLQNAATPSVTCDSNLKTSQYCHVSSLKTTVRRGVK